MGKTYFVSDIHGCYDQLLALLEKIAFSDSDTLYILGDIVDRGPNPLAIFDYIMPRENIRLILGNHEYALLTIAVGLELGVPDETIRCHTEDISQDLIYYIEDGGLPTLRALLHRTPEQQQEILDYILDACIFEELDHNGKHYILTHAGIMNYDPALDLYSYGIEAFLFGRLDYDVRLISDENTILVSGHTPTPTISGWEKEEILQANGHLAIDCACVFGGKLACYCMETEECYYVDGYQHNAKGS